MKTILIDDESDALSTLQSFLHSYCPQIHIIGHAGGVQSALHLIHHHQPELLFLDIQLEDGTGFDLLKLLGPDALHQVIFMTAFDEFAIKAFQYNAIDYLLKPINPDEVIRVVQKAFKQQQRYQIKQQTNHLLEDIQKKKFDKITLTSQEGLIILKLADIQYLKSEGSYTTIYYGAGEKVTITKLLKEFEDLLPNTHFFRPHQSYMINLDYIHKVLKEEGGMILLISGAKVPVSRRKKEQLIEWLSRN